MVFDLKASDSEEVISCLRRSPNVNSAVKGFLKREVKRGDGAERFVKDFREALISKNTERAVGYLEQKLESFEAYVVALGGYAHADMVTAVASSIVEKYADEFNATYEINAEELSIKDKGNFERIFKEALRIIDDELKAKDLYGYYMRCVMLNAIFDRPVLIQVLSQIKD